MIFIKNFKFITAANIAPEVNRLTENISPYVDFVNNEQSRLEASRQTLAEMQNELNSLDTEITDLLS